MANDLVCPICGQPTRVYMGNARKDRLCGTHADMLKAGTIVLGEDGIYRDVKTRKALNVGAEAREERKAPQRSAEAKEATSSSDLTCLLCGEPSNGKHFCLACYHKYKDRSIDIRISHCNEVEILDGYGNQQYTCRDGRKVRSKSEKLISDFLFEYKIRAIYEKTVFYYTEDGECIELHPDFYLPDYDIYIEHNGLNSKSYKASKARTEAMYKSLGYQLIVTTEKDLEDIDKALKPRLRIN